MQNFTTASLKGHRDIEEQILRLQNYINGSRYTVAITGAGISMAAGIMDFAHMNFPLVLQMSSSAVLKSAPNHYYNTARKAFLDAMFENGPSVAHKKLAEYTVDFLTKKTKINEGEVPQYYVENSHEAIISPAVFDEVQHQMAVRHPGKNRLSCTGAFSSRIKCGDCGSWYGSKVWHSNDKYRKIVWQCNHKFDGGEKCTTPHLDEETVKVLFLKAANAIFGERDSIREDYEAVKERLYDTSELEAERIQLQDEMNIVAEMIQQCVNENARVALDQAEYQKKYDGLADRFDRIKERLEAVGIAITERMAKREKTERFLAELEKRDGSLTEFDEEDWYSLVEYATVYSREDICFTFKNGMEIKA